MITPPTGPDPAQQPQQSYPPQPVSPPPFPQQYGAPVSPQPMYVVQQQPTSGLAVASLIFSILGLLAGCCTFGVFSVIAVLLGHAALRDIRETGKRGDGMAKAGLVMGYILVVPMLIFSFWVVVGAGLEAVNPSTR
ncbi:DUF4190 domain-containing protein [Micromonospora sp. WMMC415]|uniref:DUF4190 domain-containing protein n=1 Tax=Micromonospora sp. WMMC415 TaxID=2675222 RepID=UPI0018AF8C4C|nr:DUF4190 domain-containing protein [Micromonospora sp. WMMC415]